MTSLDVIIDHTIAHVYKMLYRKKNSNIHVLFVGTIQTRFFFYITYLHITCGNVELWDFLIDQICCKGIYFLKFGKERSNATLFQLKSPEMQNHDNM